MTAITQIIIILISAPFIGIGFVAAIISNALVVGFRCCMDFIEANPTYSG